MKPELIMISLFVFAVLGPFEAAAQTPPPSRTAISTSAGMEQHPRVITHPARNPPPPPPAAGPAKRLFITAVKLRGVKSGAFDRDDVSWAAVLYDNNNCAQQTVLQRTRIAKVAKRNVNIWIAVFDEITAYPTAYLSPNHTIALMLFDKDSCNCDQAFPYNLHCTGILHGQSKSRAYGTVYLKYSDFLTNGVIEFDIGGAQLRIRSADVP